MKIHKNIQHLLKTCPFYTLEVTNLILSFSGFNEIELFSAK